MKNTRNPAISVQIVSSATLVLSMTGAAGAAASCAPTRRACVMTANATSVNAVRFSTTVG